MEKIISKFSHNRVPMLTLTTQCGLKRKMSLEHFVVKGANDGNQLFLLSSQCIPEPCYIY